MSNYLEHIRVGEYVDIIVNGAILHGMPHLFYHGRTGVVYSVGPKSLGVSIGKEVRNRIIEKRLNIRREHLRKSNCRNAFIARIKVNDIAKTEANKKGERISTKRQPLLPPGQEALSLSVDTLKVHSLTPHMEFH